MLSETMDAKMAFEFRRAELAALLQERGSETKPEDVRDELVLQSFLASVTPGDDDALVLKYLKRAKLVHKFGNAIFVHGALLSNNIGVVPGQSSRISDLMQWCDALNRWSSEQILAYEQSPSDGKNGASRAAHGLIDLGVVSSGSIVSSSWEHADNKVEVHEDVRQMLVAADVSAIVCGHTPQVRP
jgi:hypothetical protein